MAHLKRIAMPKNWPVKKKEKTFVIRPRGPYKFKDSIPLLIILRDILKLGNSSKEIKKITKSGEILINNRIIKDIKFTIGLFDKISIPKLGKYFELVIKNKKLCLEEIKKEDCTRKLSKVMGKRILKKNKMQINLFGGINLILEDKKNKEIKVGDNLILNLEKKSIEKILSVKKGSKCMIIGGKNTGKVGKIIEIEEGRKKRVMIENKEGKIKVFKRNIWVIE